MNRDIETQSYPLIGSIQNSVGMGFLGNQAVYAVANNLGARVICAQSMFSSAHGGFTGRSSVIAEPQQFRRDLAFLISQRPAVLIVGFLPRPNLVDITANMLADYKGVVVLDPVIGDYKKGLYVSEETARGIKQQLLPLAQIITPNRFEAEVLLGIPPDPNTTEHQFLNGLYDLGPESVIIKSFERDRDKQRCKLLFTNGYSYYRIEAPYYSAYPAHGVGDVFAAGVATLVALGGSPFAATLVSTALAARSVANSTSYGGATVDPIAALEKWRPLGYQIEDDKTMKFCERSGVTSESIKPSAQDGPRLKFAPPKNKIIYW
ncbi:MAG: bifunctional hydroxymethylpyrimidine kinase/phosphomethylpyrimidine kinase [Candidatus Eremiobacteraeota bacterium]|nr:bifunctional hydroxymethylpyrimidine kinase/phosphomethylpyrimidine kinase [Candidatus Eremiobacteraeota bacterium]